MNAETRELVFKMSSGFCMCSKECAERATDVHHMLSRSKVNLARFPLFVDSIFNLVPLNNNCHLNKPIPKIVLAQAEAYERWLEMFRRGEA